MTDPVRGEAQPSYAITDAKLKYYRDAIKGCPGGLSCTGWSCLPIVELLATVAARDAEIERLAAIEQRAKAWRDAESDDSDASQYRRCCYHHILTGKSGGPEGEGTASSAAEGEGE